MALISDQITPRFPFPSTATTLMVRRRDAPVGGALSEGAQAKIQSKNSLSPITPLVRVTFSKEVMEGIFSVTPVPRNPSGSPPRGSASGCRKTGQRPPPPWARPFHLHQEAKRVEGLVIDNGHRPSFL